jgi:hypothetical protein
MNEVTRILSGIEAGDPHAAAQLLPLVYDELRKLAAQKLTAESPGRTLQDTALVHEAYLGLVDTDSVPHRNSRGVRVRLFGPWGGPRSQGPPRAETPQSRNQRISTGQMGGRAGQADPERNAGPPPLRVVLAGSHGVREPGRFEGASAVSRPKIPHHRPTHTDGSRVPRYVSRRKRSRHQSLTPWPQVDGPGHQSTPTIGTRQPSQTNQIFFRFSCHIFAATVGRR